MLTKTAKNKNFKAEKQDTISELYKFYIKEPKVFSLVENTVEKDGYGQGTVSLDPRPLPIELPTINQNETFNYFNFLTPTHYEQKNEIEKNSIGDFFSGVVNLEYNFLIKAYEDHIKQYKVPELNLPNFYDTVIQELVRTPDTTFNSVDFFELDLITKYKSDLQPGSLRYEKNYFDSNLSEEITSLISSDNKKNKKKIQNFFNTYNPFKEQFPFYTEIIFDNHADPSAILNINTVTTPNTSNVVPGPSGYDTFLKPEAFSPASNTSFTTNRVPNGFIKTKNFRKIFDDLDLFGSIFEYFEKNSTSYSLKTDNNVLGVNFINFSNFMDSTSITDAEKYNDLREGMLTLIGENSITYQKILNETNCYSQTIGYKISKFDTANGNKPLQVFYLPNTTEEKTEFIDTQIKYGKRYRYSVSILRMVIGAEYKYLNLSQDKKSVDFKIEPKVYLFEIDSYQYQNFLLDRPPLEPEVDIIPYIGVSNKIKFNLNTSVGKKEQVPIILQSGEAENFEFIKNAQDRKDKKILFQSDEPSDYFEVFRSEMKPKSYEDFKKSDVLKSIAENNDSSAGSFLDTIQQNKKYYYTFRSVDYHKNISNPTEIYEVEIVNDNGLIFPIIKVVDLQEDTLRVNSKQFRKFISVTPNLSNTLISLEKNNNFQDLKDASTILKSAIVGINKSGVWNKNFKIRITSLSTGRKIDFNFTFNIDKKEQ